MLRSVALVAVLFMLVAPICAQSADQYVSSRIETILSRTYNYKMISSGNNFPTVNVRKEHRGDILLLLHEQIPAEAIQLHFGWSPEDYTARIRELQDAGLVAETDDGMAVPTIMVMTLGDVARFVPVSEAVVSETVLMLVEALPDVKAQYNSIGGFEEHSWESQSLLILSDVLLDNWQINGVEAGFLVTERPLRAGSRYYYSIQEKPNWDDKESFGIYGNQFRGFGAFLVGVYGNRRDGNPLNFASLDRSGVEALFGVAPEDLKAYKEELLGHYVQTTRSSSNGMPANVREGFESLEWIKDGRATVPVLSPDENEALGEMADSMLKPLLDVLERQRGEIRGTYEISPYDAEVTFEEYFLWWYHLYYTAVTERLIAEGHVTRPEAGITSYVIADLGE